MVEIISGISFERGEMVEWKCVRIAFSGGGLLCFHLEKSMEGSK